MKQEMKTYQNNFVDLDKLQKDKSVLVSKCNAECFLLTCKMASLNPKFKLVDNKILFTI